LNLSKNLIGDSGTKHLADILRENMVSLICTVIFFYLKYFFDKTLVTLNLSNNLINDSGAKHLADAIQNNMVLFVLFPEMISPSFRNSQH
jgi:hypothetical protein